MNKGFLIHAAWLAAAAGAFAIGRITSSPSEGGAAGSNALSSGPSGLASPLSATGTASSKKGEAADGTAATRAPGKTGSVLATIDAIKNETDDVKKNFLFAQMLMDLTPENADEMLAALRESGVLTDGRDFGPGGKMGLFFQAWGKVDGQAAVEAAIAMNEEDGADRRGPGGMGRAGFGAMAALSSWGAGDPTGAMAWIDTLEDGGQKQMMTMGLINGMASTDPDAASAYILKNIASNATGEDPRGGWMNGRLYETVADEQIKKGMDSAMAWASGLPDGDFKNSALSRIAGEYAREDITKAAAWATSIAGQEGSADAIRQVAERMGREDPQAAIDWLVKLPEGSQDRAIGETFRQWTETDNVAASQYLATMPASATKDNAVAGFVRQLDREDPESAMVWANTIADTELRANTVTAVAQSWVRTNREAAVAYMQTSGMTAEQQTAVIESASRGGRGGPGGGGPGGGGRGGQGGGRGR